ncbi:RecQ family ATP-dependent DNA helicase [Pallidibacillus pasinlerensis]|uniref:ATP-dependent DNA helicase RecQ n=1 Tax=Pallidibacillus pasinlerensis TaxID=2703818 RepID=A0ABW9ZYV4_9BACI|nr:ATP-dependent DNA helicase RecQ [Pallidibacillus pasinlerensis]NCU16351.1 ATP-dependent DNA helicase RecQ [Pallidibacillus pasinlerensis]
MNLEQILQKHFSFKAFRTGQKEIIQSILENKNTLALLPTGTGKSLCYQLPGYILDGIILIISPLLSLMQDQVEQMKLKGEKRVVAINSFLTFEERNFVLNNIENYKFIYISPEMLQNEQIASIFQKVKISLLVIDEAHCISQWGYDFRPDYLELGNVRKKLGNPVTLALTATAKFDVRKDIKKYLFMEDAKEYIFSMDRPNISIQVEKIRDYPEKLQRLIELVDKLQGPGIIYFSSKKKADEVAQLLNEKGLCKVASYHAGLDQEMRILLQQQFLYNQIDVMCATSAFGMGVNKENVRYVIHFHPPLNIESYLQEIGRAGRDGNESIAIMLYSEDDFFLQQQLLENELPNDTHIDVFTDLVRSSNKTNDFSRNQPYPGYSEVHWRILWKYYESSNGVHEFQSTMKSFVKTRLQIKKEKLQELINWILTNGCRRKNILHIFEQEETKRVSNCCDFCGIDFTRFKKQEKLKLSEKTWMWRDRLKSIFQIEELK